MARLNRNYFNMIEISFALLVIAIGVTTIFGLIPIGTSAHADAIGTNQAADAAENIMAKLSAEVQGQTNWDALVKGSGIGINPASISYHDSGHSGFLSNTSWAHVDSGSNLGSNEPGLYLYSTSTNGNIYRFVQVTTMAGDIYDFMTECLVLKSVKMTDLDAVINAIPKPGYQDFSDLNGGVGIIGCYFPHILYSLSASLLLRDARPAGLFFNGCAYCG